MRSLLGSGQALVGHKQEARREPWQDEPVVEQLFVLLHVRDEHSHAPVRALPQRVAATRDYTDLEPV